jgi:CRP/FNR family transcriptional regulator/CRP/FNR family cyclic AMP-dependent transcriptional regulator
VKVVLLGSDGQETILAILSTPGFFGELALLDGEPHSASAIAVEPTETLVLGREAFDRLLDEQPALRRALLAALAGELRRLTGHVESLHFLDLAGRLASRIADLVETSPSVDTDRAGGERRVAWPFTQAELAGMIGGSRESVNRILNDFTARGLLRFERDTLVVPDPGALAEVGR